MWWKDYGDKRPAFVKAFNAKTHNNRELLTDEVERMAWNYHYSYMYRQMVYERSKGWGKLELVTKEYPPTGYWLPVLLETDINRPVTKNIIKQRESHKRTGFYAPKDLFNNPFEVVADIQNNWEKIT